MMPFAGVARTNLPTPRQTLAYVPNHGEPHERAFGSRIISRPFAGRRLGAFRVATTFFGLGLLACLRLRFTEPSLVLQCPRDFQA